jgi:ribosomal protein S18 acetylase RimI-like enzyme
MTTAEAATETLPAAGPTPARQGATGDVRVRPARSHDLNDVVAVWDGCGLVPSEQGFRNELTYKLLRDPTLALVAERDGQILGAVVGGYDGRASWVSRLGVRADARRQGIARQLVAELLVRLAALGAPTDDLVVLDDGEAGRAFWSALGFSDASGATRYRRSPVAG